MSLNEQQLNEIKRSKELQYPTSRATIEALEQIIYNPIKVLDHGFVRVIDYMGDDAAIVQAARLSYGKGTKKTNEDKGLIRYLMRHWHTTPFEMCEIKLHVKLPIFVARQWIRHRTANVNEYSARYSVLDKEFYIPSPEHLAAQSHSNRQGRGEILEGKEAARVFEILKQDAQTCYSHYMEMLNLNDETNEVLDSEKLGLTRELARMNIPTNFYTQWYWKIDLHNLLHFLRLRADPHAQFEIREYSNAILEIVKKWVPITYEAFQDYRMNAVSISEQGIKIIKRMLAGENVSQEMSGMSAREWNELMSTLDLPIL